MTMPFPGGESENPSSSRAEFVLEQAEERLIEIGLDLHAAQRAFLNQPLFAQWNDKYKRTVDYGQSYESVVETIALASVNSVAMWNFAAFERKRRHDGIVETVRYKSQVPFSTQGYRAKNIVKALYTASYNADFELEQAFINIAGSTRWRQRDLSFTQKSDLADVLKRQTGAELDHENSLIMYAAGKKAYLALQSLGVSLPDASEVFPE